MPKSTRALIGMVMLDLLIALGAGWMIVQTRTGAWSAADPESAISTITTVAGAAIGVVTAVLLAAYFRHRRLGR